MALPRSAAIDSGLVDVAEHAAIESNSPTAHVRAGNRLRSGLLTGRRVCEKRRWDPPAVIVTDHPGEDGPTQPSLSQGRDP